MENTNVSSDESVNECARGNMGALGFLWTWWDTKIDLGKSTTESHPLSEFVIICICMLPVA